MPHLLERSLVETARDGKGEFFLTWYLKGRADAGAAEWVESILDTWAKEEAHLTNVIFEYIWHQGDVPLWRFVFHCPRSIGNEVCLYFIGLPAKGGSMFHFSVIHISNLNSVDIKK